MTPVKTERKLGRPPLPAADKLTEALTLLMTKEQHRTIEKQAIERGIKRQAYIRYVIECATKELI